MRLIDEFHLFVAETHSLQKVFVSIKGYYLQAKVLGEAVTWLVPHQFTQILPSEVDFKVMTTFLDYYRTMVKFVNYKLYELENFSYPPTCSSVPLTVGSRFLSLTTNTLKASKQSELEEDDKDDRDPDSIDDNDSKVSRLFTNLTFFVSREVPKPPLVFMIRSFGGTVGWEQEHSPIDVADPSITHQIVDRPVAQMVPGTSREYVQPQWIFDSINSGVLLPVDAYAAGAALPPHLSPFVDDAAEGYVPQQREVLETIIQGKKAETANQGQIDEESETSDVEEIREKEKLFHQRENKEGSVPESQPQVSRKAIRKEAKDKEEIDRRKALLSKKHKRLLHRIENGVRTKASGVEKLKKRRNASAK